MAEFISGAFLLFIAFVVFTWMFAFIRRLLSLVRTDKSISGMDSGLFVEHGMVFDKEMGIVKAQKKPSARAYTHLA